VSAEMVRYGRDGQPLAEGSLREALPPCPACGATGHAADARFCRRCASPLDA